MASTIRREIYTVLEIYCQKAIPLWTFFDSINFLLPLYLLSDTGGIDNPSFLPGTPSIEISEHDGIEIDTEKNISVSISTTHETPSGSEGKGTYRVTGKKLILQQFMALFVKRFHHARLYKSYVTKPI